MPQFRLGSILAIAIVADAIALAPYVYAVDAPCMNALLLLLLSMLPKGLVSDAKPYVQTC